MTKLLLILACAAIAGCNWERDNLPSPASACLPHFGAVKLHVVQVRGHDYLLASEFFGRCAAIVHAASCPCMAPKMYSLEELATTNSFLRLRDYIDEMTRDYIEKEVK